MNDEQKAIDQLSIVMNLPKEEIARIIKRIVQESLTIYDSKFSFDFTRRP